MDLVKMPVRNDNKIEALLSFTHYSFTTMSKLVREDRAVWNVWEVWMGNINLNPDQPKTRSI